MKDVFTIIQGNGRNKKPFWQKIGVAFPNKDGSLSVVLNALPVDGRLQIRDAKETRTQTDNQTSQ